MGYQTNTKAPKVEAVLRYAQVGAQMYHVWNNLRL